MATGLAFGVGVHPAAADVLHAPHALCMRIEGSEAYVAFRDFNSEEEQYLVNAFERDTNRLVVDDVPFPAVPGGDIGGGRDVTRQVSGMPGTPLWAERARAELDRASGARTRAELTASEQRVAELAAAGVTIREMAAALFISPKPVESNLSRIYRKLNIHSRAELGRHMSRPDG
ncbi:MAG TPA: helix-turn-helix transcriptional regulator [Mycobacterium sp.]|nr:helix-turn-helix transcriptional regulator [Mycobacterium sp.]